MTKRLTTQEFIERATKVHGTKYDYSLVEFKGMHKDVIIICELHGSFKQRPSNHISCARGCPVCANIKTTSHTRKSLEIYLPKITDIHADKYTLCDFDYVNYKTKGIVHCNCGNSFNMSVEHLLRGRGCPSCAKSGFKPEKPCFFYVIKINDEVIKCGISVDIRSRFTRLKNQCTSSEFEPLYCVHFENSILAKDLEDTVKRHFNRLPSDKNLLSDGFTETYCISDIGSILKAACDYTEKHSGKFLSYEEICSPD